MKNIFLMMVLMVLFAACEEDDFYDKFVPEIMYYQYDRVETPDFKETGLSGAVTDYLVKARVSAPFELKEIRLFRDGSLQTSLSDFSNELKPTEYFLQYHVGDIRTTTVIRIVALDKDGRESQKDFSIIVH